MDNKELIKKIIKKKEFSQLPEIDVKLAFEHFDKPQYIDEEKVKLTRDLLRKVFSAFTSRKLLNLKDKDYEWFLKKHTSTRERLNFYPEIYQRILKGFDKKASIIDLGAGINGFSYNYFKENINYVAVESIGQFVDLMNNYFKNNRIKANAYHASLFELEKVKKIIRKTEKPRIVFLFKTLDSLEMLKRDYSKELLLALSSFVDRFVVSFATRSLIRRTRFKVKRSWILNFIKDGFKILDDNVAEIFLFSLSVNL
ncbi:hypothetical protein ACFLZJ_02180, partial [Nanoarchaeota archaeon]